MSGRSEVIEALRRRVRAAEGGFGDAGLRRHVPTGLEALDRVLPGGGLPAGALVEVLVSPGGGGGTLACLIARAACGYHINRPDITPGKGAAESNSNNNINSGGLAAWIDREGLYPPALSRIGPPLDAVLWVRPHTMDDALWAFEQATRSPAIAVSVVSARRIGQAMTRRLQLSAEAGGGIALLLRPGEDASSPSAAAVRLRVEPVAAGQSIQTEHAPRRLSVGILKARGSFIYNTCIVEVDDATGFVSCVPAPFIGQDFAEPGAACA